MAYRVILDTSAVIELLNRNDQRVLDQIEKEGSEEVFISGITKFELEIGGDGDVRIGDIPCLPIGCEAFSLAAKIYSELCTKGKEPSLKDCFIAACAIIEDGVLITYDRDFEIFLEYGLNAKILKK